MAYKNLNKNYNPTSDTGIRTNLPIEPIQNLNNTQKTMRIFGDYFDSAITLHSDEYDAVISFFTGKDYEKRSAETIAYVICRQAKLDNVPAMSIVDKLSESTPQELSDVVAEILNLYRFKSSLIGSKVSNPSPEIISRNILG
jgi:hypothetical protein